MALFTVHLTVDLPSNSESITHSPVSMSCWRIGAPKPPLPRDCAPLPVREGGKAVIGK